MREAKPAGPIELVRLEEAGILPDSPFYFVKILGEKIRGMFAFSESAKVKYQYQIAERRLKESVLLKQKGKQELSLKIVRKYQEIVDNTDQKLEEIGSRGALYVPMLEARYKHLQTLENVFDRVPDEAKDAIERVLERERLKAGEVVPGMPPGATPLPEPTVSPRASGGCKITGCGGEVCSDKEVNTACVWKDEDICYRTAKCERQQNNRCGWTMTEMLRLCLSDPPVTSDNQPGPASSPRPLISWEECIKVPGSRILLTYPRQCVIPDGRRAIEQGR